QRDSISDDSVPRTLCVEAAARGLVRRQHDAERHVARYRNGSQVERPCSHYSAGERIPDCGSRDGLGDAGFCRRVRRPGANVRAAEMTTATQPAEKAERVELWLRMYRKMLTIRLFEARVNDLYTRALMPGLAHLYVGEEAVAVGVCEALRTTD